MVQIHCQQAQQPLAQELSCPNLSCGIPTACKSLGHSRERSAQHHLSDLCLECSNWKSLHDGPGWLCLDLHLLTEGHPRSSLGGWFHTCLDPAKARDCEDAILLHLCCGAH